MGTALKTLKVDYTGDIIGYRQELGIVTSGKEI
jgi:hypothetical protein